MNNTTLTLAELRNIVTSVLNEEVTDIEEFPGAVCVPGSTHTMMTCKVGADKYFIKFSHGAGLSKSHDLSLQILVEYLAYKIYSLYPNVDVPSNIKLVWDAKKKSVGLATGAVEGKDAFGRINTKALAKMMSAGVYVDVLLANWDVIGTGSGNIIADKEKATRIDPGGVLTFRAQGARKGNKFSSKAGEMQTMLDPDFGAGEVLSRSDLKLAAKTFLSVPWSAIQQAINEVTEEVSGGLEKRGADALLGAWLKEADEITSKLASRYEDIVGQVKGAQRV